MVGQRGGSLDGTPEKRLFLSIMADYDLRTGLCELIDNAIDHWTDSGRPGNVRIDVNLDADRQLIKVSDNAGGVSEDRLKLLIAPGATRPTGSEEFIGIFGVGGKRAGIALGERVEIRTRFGRKRSFGIDVTTDWLESDSWDIDYFQVPEIEPGTTSLLISSLRQRFTKEDVDDLRTRFGETYSWFIGKGCAIRLNGRAISPVRFDRWAYPPEHPPTRVPFTIEPAPGQQLGVRIEGGLIRDRDPEADNYGVYVYCNERMVIKELKSRDVGYMTGEAGVPHPDASLCRVIVYLNGPATAMPWNSSKSGLNLNHPGFTLIRGQIIQLVAYYSTLSRRLKNEWEESVIRHARGSPKIENPQEVAAGHRIVLPELPRARAPSYIDQIQEKNVRALATKPWIRGIVDALGIIDMIARSKLQTRNRSALILLDSNFEIALKEYIVNEPKLFPPKEYDDARLTKLLTDRRLLLAKVACHVAVLTAPKIDLCVHYAAVRARLTSSRLTPSISDQDIREYRALTEAVLRSMLKVRVPRT